MRPVRTLMIAVLVLLSACTMRSAVEAMTSEEDRALAQEMVSRLRSGDGDWLQQRFRPDLWEQSAKQIGAARDLYPADPEPAEIISFNVSSNMSGGRTERTKEFTLVSQGSGRWTITYFRTYSTGGPDEVVEWRVTPHASPPPELTMIQAWDRMVPFIWAGLVIVLAGVGFLVFWLVRRSRRRHDPLAGSPRTL